MGKTHTRTTRFTYKNQKTAKGLEKNERMMLIMPEIIKRKFNKIEQNICNKGNVGKTWKDDALATHTGTYKDLFAIGQNFNKKNFSIEKKQCQTKIFIFHQFTD